MKRLIKKIFIIKRIVNIVIMLKMCDTFFKFHDLVQKQLLKVKCKCSSDCRCTNDLLADQFFEHLGEHFEIKRNLLKRKLSNDDNDNDQKIVRKAFGSGDQISINKFSSSPPPFARRDVKTMKMISAEQVKSLTKSLKPTSDRVNVFVDGSCVNNGRANARAGFGVYWPHDPTMNVSEEIQVGAKTNNRGELMAIIRAIDQAHENKINKLEIFSDSMYAINCLTVWFNKWQKCGWKTSDGKDVQNCDLIKSFLDKKKSLDVKFTHVKAHNGNDGNEKADYLAKKAIDLSF